MNNLPPPPPGPPRLVRERERRLNRTTKDYILGLIDIIDMTHQQKDDAKYQIEHALDGRLPDNVRQAYEQFVIELTNSLNADAANEEINDVEMQMGGRRRRKSSRKNKRKTSSRSRSSKTAKKSKKSKRSRKTSRTSKSKPKRK